MHKPGGSCRTLPFALARLSCSCDTSDLHICHMTSVWDADDFPQTPYVEGIFYLGIILVTVSVQVSKQYSKMDRM